MRAPLQQRPWPCSRRQGRLTTPCPGVARIPHGTLCWRGHPCESQHSPRGNPVPGRHRRRVPGSERRCPFRTFGAPLQGTLSCPSLRSYGSRRLRILLDRCPSIVLHLLATGNDEPLRLLGSAVNHDIDSLHVLPPPLTPRPLRELINEPCPRMRLLRHHVPDFLNSSTWMRATLTSAIDSAQVRQSTLSLATYGQTIKVNSAGPGISRSANASPFCGPPQVAQGPTSANPHLPPIFFGHSNSIGQTRFGVSAGRRLPDPRQPRCLSHNPPPGTHTANPHYRLEASRARWLGLPAVAEERQRAANALALLHATWCAQKCAWVAICTSRRIVVLTAVSPQKKLHTTKPRICLELTRRVGKLS